ncbi:hypothetical protein [Pseudomonas sp. MWU13-2105]|uniref:hypothetical protein n=1 Tax=Pseudomonas sp. MWU13-2105 TaxID=2935074 RepID=UPI00200C9566|nr:hypothetical protein [Pseudomonas sp. MWU13-2105]
MKSSKHLDNALEAAGCIEEKLKAAVEAWRADIDRFASSYELKGVDHELRCQYRCKTDNRIERDRAKEQRPDRIGKWMVILMTTVIIILTVFKLHIESL